MKILVTGGLVHRFNFCSLTEKRVLGKFRNMNQGIASQKAMKRHLNGYPTMRTGSKQALPSKQHVRISKLSI